MNHDVRVSRGVALALLWTMAAPAGAKPAPSPAAAYSGYGEGSVSREILQKYAPQELPRDLASAIQKRLDIRAPGAGLPSPDGKSIFFSWGVTGSNQIWRMDGPRTFPTQLTAGDDTTWPADVTADGKWLVLQRDEGGQEAPGIFLLDALRGGPLTTVYQKDKIVASLEYSTDDGRFLVFRANDIKPDSYAIYRYEIASGKTELLFSEDGIWSVSDYQEDGTLLLTRHRGNFAQEIFVWSPKTKALTPVIGQGESVSYSARFAAKDGEYIVQSDKLGEFQSLYRLANGKLERIVPDVPADVVGFDIDGKRERIIYQLNDQGYTRLLALDAKSFKPLDAISPSKLPELKSAYHVNVAGMTRDGRYMTLAVEGAKAPRTGYMFDWRRGRLTQWSQPSMPEVDTSRFVDATLEHYPTRDGAKIPMIVRRPANCAKPCPVVVSFHGGPEAQSKPGFDLYGQMFVDNGFVFVEPNVRGSTGYGKAWRDMDNGAKRLDVLGDIEDAAIYMRKNWSENGREPKIGITGGSYGGYATLVGMTRYAGAYDAGVSIVGISNLVTFLTNTAPFRRALRVAEYGDLEKDREVLQKLSPINDIDRIKGPLLVIQGANDPRVPVGEAVQFHEAMVRKKIPSRLMIFADEGHGSAKRSNRVLEIGHTLAFFQEHLQGKAARGE